MAIHIKDIIGDFFKNSEDFVEKRRKFDMIVAPYLSGRLKENVVFTGIEKNSMVFNSVSSSFSYEFSLQKEKLLKDIQREFPYIEDVKIKVR